MIFQRRKKKCIIFYRDIKEVEKMMIINRYHSEKGYYRVKVRKRGFSYAVYSGEDEEKKLDFEQTGVSEVYHEFGRRGMKCC